VGRRAGKSSSPGIRFLTKPITHTVNLRTLRFTPHCKYKPDLTVSFAKYKSGDHMKNEMGGACGMYGRQDRCLQGSDGET
jgi:hypothetical protein